VNPSKKVTDKNDPRANGKKNIIIVGAQIDSPILAFTAS